ncbi:MAG: hypothetical protein Q7J73_01070 [Dehalococcoidales bacterium]|nr:hypothetical protein [Dehalococcoidales bacterium]
MSDEEETPGSEEGTETSIEQEAAVATETTDVSKPEKPANELKVVIILKDDRAMLGVQSPNCDPVYKTMEGDLSAVLQVLPTLVADAKLQWAAAPRYPKADLPKPVAPATTTTAAVSKPSAKAAPAQPKFF